MTTTTYGNGPLLLLCALIKTRKRITFEILKQSRSVTNTNENGMITFTASNGYEIISEHRLDIQSRRIWLRGAADDEPAQRSGTMALPTQQMCDETFPQYIDALAEWAAHNNGSVAIEVIEF